MDKFEEIILGKIEICINNIESKKCDSVEKTTLIALCEAYYDSLSVYRSLKNEPKEDRK